MKMKHFKPGLIGLAIAMPFAASAAYTENVHVDKGSFEHYSGDGGHAWETSHGASFGGHEFDGPKHGADGGFGGGHGMTGAVPEPEEWAMLATGFGLVGYQVRRKQRKLGGNPLA